MRDPARPRALILVRNTVTHDARILREADTLAGLGLEVLIAGVVSTAERERNLELEGKPVVRLDPLGAIHRVTRLLRGRAPARESAAPRPLPAPLQAQPDAVPAQARPVAALRTRLRRLALTLVYYVQGIALAWRVAPAIVHANDYNTMWIGVAAKLLRGSWLVYDCHELWPDRNGRPEWRPWLIACEALFVRLADATITTSPGYAEAIAARYRVPAPRVVRNIPRQVDGSGEVNPARSAAVAVYLGGVMPGRGLEQVIAALALAPALRIRVIGPGRDAYRASLARLAADAGVGDRLELLEALPLAEALRSIAGCDMGLMLIQPVCRSYALTLPNKLFEYAVAGLPILASDLPVIGQVVRSEGIGEVVAPEDTEQIARAMERLADPDVNARLRERAAAFAKRETWERERELLAAVYAEALGATAKA